ncbi:MAG TPA: hypothetical protein VLB82_06065 [Thermodesulfobacteriota bacterium]|nr:hypothetical protein [Thermodesulfobacteriota bacterium]
MKLELDKIEDNDYEGRIIYSDKFNTDLEEERVLERFDEIKKDKPITGYITQFLTNNGGKKCIHDFPWFCGEGIGPTCVPESTIKVKSIIFGHNFNPSEFYIYFNFSIDRNEDREHFEENIKYYFPQFWWQSFNGNSGDGKSLGWQFNIKFYDCEKCRKEIDEHGSVTEFREYIKELHRYKEGEYYDGLGKYLGIETLYLYGENYIIKQHKFAENPSVVGRDVSKINNIFIKKLDR